MIIKTDGKCIKEVSDRLMSKGGKKGGKLAPKTVYDILSVTKTIFHYGFEHGYPCSDLKEVKMPTLGKKKTKIVNKTSREMIEKTIIGSEYCEKNFRVKLGILLTLYTGIRIGELCGLKETDVDLTNNIVHINRTIERISDLDCNSKSKTKVVINEPKTESSLRIIPLPSFLAEYLKSFLTKENNYLITGTEKYTEPHQFYMRYKTFMRTLGLEEYSFHALRHTFATRCIENGFDAKSLSEILGHANVNTTLSLYVHPTIEQKRKQMERLKPDFHL